MELYLYCCQDLNIFNTDYKIRAGDFYKLDINLDETITLYSTTNAGVMIVNKDILSTKLHNQITFHDINSTAIICEINPFISKQNVIQYSINGATVGIVKNTEGVYIFFKGIYQGFIQGQMDKLSFEKIDNEVKQYGVITFFCGEKHIIFFNNKQIMFCGQYVDKEILKTHIQIYFHIPNVFNIGNLLEYKFGEDTISIKSVCDRGEEKKLISSQFNIIYFLEAIKCGRFKYAYNKLSYGLKSEISVEALSQYFDRFDNFKYLPDQDVYITLKNNKILGVYHFELKDNMIANIY